MYRNSSFGPFFFLLLGVVFLLATFLSWEKIVLRTGSAPAALDTIQIALAAFGMTFLVYAGIGFVSVWLEGAEHRPRAQRARPGPLAFALGLFFCLLMVALSGLFFHVIITGITGTKLPSMIEGFVAGGLSLAAVGLLLVYQKYFTDHEVIAEDEHTEVPW